MSLPGSKPKTFIRKTNYNNPSLTSYDVSNIFNPEIFGDRDYYKKLYLKKPKDALSRAENEYDQKRSKSTIHERGKHETQVAEKVTKVDEKVGKFNHDMNFVNFQCKYVGKTAIKNKQLHGYNILNNI